MTNDEVKKEFQKVVLKAKIAAGIFFILLTPSIVLTVKDLDEVFGFNKDMWFNASLFGFAIYGGFTLFLWKCPKCKKFPGRGWFRKNCDNCDVELT